MLHQGACSPSLGKADTRYTTYSNGHHEYLWSSLIDSCFQPRQLTLVTILHLLKRAEQFLVAKCAGRLLKDEQRHHALIYEQPEIMEVSEHVKSTLASFHKQGFVEALRLAFPALAVLRNKWLEH